MEIPLTQFYNMISRERLPSRDQAWGQRRGLSAVCSRPNSYSPCRVLGHWPSIWKALGGLLG